MRNVLFVVFFFPPTGGGPSMRAAKFVKYLPLYGWRPIVITPDRKSKDNFDHSMITEMPEDVRIFYTEFLFHRSLLKMINKIIPYLHKNRKEGITSPKKEKVYHIKKKSWLKSFYWDTLNIPDSTIQWLPYAAYKQKKIAKRLAFDLIFVTIPPHGVSLTGIFLKFLSGQRLIVDYRDAWISNPYYTPHSKWRFQIERWLEYKVLKYADQVIVASQAHLDRIEQVHPSIPRNKIQVIENGFDPADFPKNTQKIAKEPTSKFTISYIGSLDLVKLDPRLIFQAVQELLQLNRIPKDDLVLEIIGYIPQTYKEMVDAFEISHNVRILSHMPHHKAIEKMLKSDVLLVIIWTEEAKTCVPAKTYEYLRAGKPIIVLTEKDAAVSSLLKDFPECYFFKSNELENLRETIYQLYSRYCSGELPKYIQRDNISRFERRNLTSKLVNIFDELTREKGITCDASYL